MKLKGNSDTLWRHMGLILAQLDGLQAGAAYWAKTQQIEVRMFEGECVHVVATPAVLAKCVYINMNHA